MRFFNLDCHIAVIADLVEVFDSLGHSVTSWSISGHNWVFGRSATDVDVVTPQTWRSIDVRMAEEFWSRYGDFLDGFDGFICTYPPAFSLLYQRSNKPIIIQAPIRYEVPYTNKPESWCSFNDYLRDGIDSERIIPVANSLYDKKYCELFTEREWRLIPNICGYTKTNWAPKTPKFLYSGKPPFRFTKHYVFLSWIQSAFASFSFSRRRAFRKLLMTNDVLVPFRHPLVNKGKLGGYSWEELSEFQGIVMIPYNASTMSLFEHYSANIPVFIPSKRFLVELWRSYSRLGVLSELSWNQVLGLAPQSQIPFNRSVPDPNAFDSLEAVEYWLDFADFYNEDWMPHLVYFDSWEELDYKLSNTDLNNVSCKMREFNLVRRERIGRLWESTLNGIS